MKIKILHYLLVIIFSSSLVFLNGCSYFKSGKKSVRNQAGVQQTETSGFSDEGDFDEEELSFANRLKAPYNQSYYFDFDGFVVNQSDVESLKVQANYLAAHPKALVRLEGNTDERGSREYNVALGWKRARAIASVLKQEGVRDQQLVLVSFGEEKPRALGHDEESYGKNRRVDLIYEAK